MQKGKGYYYRPIAARPDTLLSSGVRVAVSLATLCLWFVIVLALIVAADVDSPADFHRAFWAVLSSLF